MTERRRHLAGVRVLVTRPRYAARRLADALAAEGADAVCVPAMEIAPVDDTRSAARLREQLADVSVSVFTSANAVDGFFRLVASGASDRLPPVVLAVGRATAEALRVRGVAGVRTPSGGFDSEGLLACPELGSGQVAGRLVAIVKGEGGRDLLARELDRRGAGVIEANVYRRRAPERLADRLDDVRGTIDVVTATSAEALRNLLDAAPWTRSWLSGVVVVVASARVADVARACGLTRVVVACGADAASIVEATARAVTAEPRASAIRGDDPRGREYSVH